MYCKPLGGETKRGAGDIRAGERAPVTFVQAKLLLGIFVWTNVLPATLVRSNVLQAPGGETNVLPATSVQTKMLSSSFV